MISQRTYIISLISRGLRYFRAFFTKWRTQLFKKALIPAPQTKPLVFQMERRGKILLLSLILLIAGAFVVVDAYAQEIVVCYPIGLALALLGSIFWLNAE